VEGVAVKVPESDQVPVQVKGFASFLLQEGPFSGYNPALMREADFGLSPFSLWPIAVPGRTQT
jgi:hypothetical protein